MLYACERPQRGWHAHYELLVCGGSCAHVHLQANNVVARPASAARGPAEALAA